MLPIISLAGCVKFENGTIANISYFANGSKKLSKEYLEVYSNGITAIITDFKQLEIYGNKKTVLKGNQNKGHANEVLAFLDSIEKGIESVYSKASS